MTTLYCPACGTLNQPAARFCLSCGSRLADAAGPACPRCGANPLPGDRFCDECGAALPPPVLIILEETGWRVALPDQSESVVGREDPLSGEKPGIDLAPHGAERYGVSRHHARLTRTGGTYTLEDLNSVNLTYLNDQRLEPGRTATLKDGDRISLGTMRLIFRQV
ncbi:MAG TPA: FHA domain-containing protein [Anaerolineae bacterium]